MIDVTVKVPEDRVGEFYSMFGTWLTGSLSVATALDIATVEDSREDRRPCRVPTQNWLLWCGTSSVIPLGACSQRLSTRPTTGSVVTTWRECWALKRASSQSLVYSPGRVAIAAKSTAHFPGLLITPVES